LGRKSNQFSSYGHGSEPPKIHIKNRTGMFGSRRAISLLNIKESPMTRPSVSFGLPIMACLLGMPLTFVNCTGSPEARCARHLASGKKLLAAKDYARAILEFRNAASAMPRNPEPLYELGLAYVATGNASDFQVAVKSFSKALELDPKHAGARLELARLMALTRATPARSLNSETPLPQCPGIRSLFTSLGSRMWRLGTQAISSRHIRE